MMLRSLMFHGVALLLAASFAAACASERATLKGTVTYTQRVALTPEAVVEVELIDVSRQDVAAEVVASQTITNPGQVPIAFEIPYDRSRIDARHTYAVQARILVGGELGWKNTTSHPVLTHGAPDSVEVIVVPISLCDQETATVDAIDRFVRALEDSRDELTQVSGEWRRGELSATFTAYLQRAEPSIVEERIASDDYGTLRAWYYFCEGTLVLYRSEGRLILEPQDGRYHDVARRLYFDRRGALLSGEKVVDGEVVDIEDQEVQEILDSLPSLREAVSQVD